MILNGFAGRTVRQVEREDNCLRIVFEDGGYLYVRVKGPEGIRLRVNCLQTRCQPRPCEPDLEIEPAPSD